MKFSRLFFLLPFFLFSSCIAEEFWCSAVHSNSVWDVDENTSNDPNSYTFWQSNDGNFSLKLSAVENNFLPRVEPQRIESQHVITWPKYNNKNVDKFNPVEWGECCTKITGVEPSKWAPEARRALYDHFELWIHPNFIIFMEGLPDFYEYFLETYEESFHDPELRKKIESNYVETNWYNLFSGKTIKDYFQENYKHATQTVEARAKRKREDDAKKAEQERLNKKREQERIAQQKRDEVAENVRRYLLEREENLEAIASELHEKAERAYIEFEREENEITNRYQQRMESFQKACDNFFHFEHKLYDVSEKTSSLLKKQNIDPGHFSQCTGNAIQQQFHKEFVDVLNGSADLTNLDFCFDGQLLFFAVSDFSRVGCICNNAGQINLAQQFADTCWELYETGRFARFLYEAGKEGFKNTIWSGMCTVAKAIYDDPKGCAIEVKDFCSDVLHKAFVRPLEHLDAFIEANEKDPALIPKILGKVAQNMMIFAAKQHELELACRHDPHSPATRKLFDDFETNHMQPLHQKVEKAMKDFRDMPTKEKFEEICAFFLQAGVIKFASGSLQAAGAAVEGASTSVLVDDLLANIGMSGGGAALPLPVPVAAGVPSGIVTGLGSAVEAGGWAALGVSKFAHFMGDDFGYGESLCRDGQEVLLDSTKKITTLPESGATINGRYYYKHALERMAENTYQIREHLAKRAGWVTKGSDKFKDIVKPRGIHSQRVEEVIRVAKKVRDKNRLGRWNYTARGLKVVTDSHGGVITVFEL